MASGIFSQAWGGGEHDLQDLRISVSHSWNPICFHSSYRLEITTFLTPSHPGFKGQNTSECLQPIDPVRSKLWHFAQIEKQGNVVFPALSFSLLFKIDAVLTETVKGVFINTTSCVHSFVDSFFYSCSSSLVDFLTHTRCLEMGRREESDFVLCQSETTGNEMVLGRLFKYEWWGPLQKIAEVWRECPHLGGGIVIVCGGGELIV